MVINVVTRAIFILCRISKFQRFSSVSAIIIKEANYPTFLRKAKDQNITSKALMIQSQATEPRESRTELTKHYLEKKLAPTDTLIPIKEEYKSIKQNIKESTNEQGYTNICTTVHRNYQRMGDHLKDKHLRKLESRKC
ncbi:hypothetical protein Trydic_g15055 [Trypoxylus dichotomus]